MENLPDRSRSALGAPASPLPPVVDEGQERDEETMPLRDLVLTLGLHLTALCNHPANYEHRYEDGYPCPGCYDARDAFEAWQANQEVVLAHRDYALGFTLTAQQRVDVGAADPNPFPMVHLFRKASR